jgi:hypothetical protein
MFDFDKKDVSVLTTELGLEDEKQMNIFLPKCYWRGNTVTLDRNGLHLNLQNVTDFVKYLILRSDTDRIAPSWSERFNKGTYKFALVEKGEELTDKVSNLEDKTRAYVIFGKMSSSAEKLRDFLYVYYLQKKDAKRPARNASLDFLKQEVGRIIEEDLKLYLEILNDQDYNTKLLIQKSVEVGALRRDRNMYSIPGQEAPIGNVEELLGYLDDPKNQTVRIKLLHQVENTK